jgi:hypothetical protein
MQKIAAELIKLAAESFKLAGNSFNLAPILFKFHSIQLQISLKLKPSSSISSKSTQTC